MSCRGGFVYPPVNRRYVLQNFNLIACRTLQNVVSALRHQIMVSVNEMDRMDYLYRRNALGRICKSAPTVQEILFQQSHVSPPLRCRPAKL